MEVAVGFAAVVIEDVGRKAAFLRFTVNKIDLPQGQFAIIAGIVADVIRAVGTQGIVVFEVHGFYRQFPAAIGGSGFRKKDNFIQLHKSLAFRCKAIGIPACRTGRSSVDGITGTGTIVARGVIKPGDVVPRFNGIDVPEFFFACSEARHIITIFLCCIQAGVF